jgi:hypothetical protein
MANDIIDINVYETTETVEITVNPNLTTVNINQVTGGGGGGATDLEYIATPTDGTVTSSTGSGATIPLADGTNAGLITSAEKTKIANSVPYTGATSDVNLGEFGIQLGNLEFDNTPTNIPTTAGSMYYNDTDGTLDLILKGGNVTLQVGQETVIRVVNKTSTNVSLLESNYQAVRITGAQGQRPKVDLAQATNDVLSAETIGLVTETIANNQEGFITTSGLVRGINTTGSLQGETWLDGDILYLSPTVAGSITKVKPVAPNHLIIIGYVISAHITQGTIFVKVDNGYELNELHNVKINGVANNNVLAYTLSTDIWENKTVASALGYTPYNETNPSGYQTASQVQTIADAKVANTITNGVTTSAPNQDVVFDALALKANDNSVVHLTENETIAGTKTFSSNIVIPATGTALILSASSGGTVSGLTTTTYPDLTELSYVKGVTSAIQTQLNGKQPLATVLTNTTASFTTEDETKLDGIATGATANSSDATLLARANHTGTQLSNTISDFNSATRAETEAELVAGTNITITPSGTGATRQLTIAATGGGTSTQSAFTVLANNTNATAAPTEQPFESIAQQAYSGTIVQTATTAASGTTNHSYQWTQVGKLVSLRINIDFASSGISISQIACELPSDCPAPALPTGVSASGDVINYGIGTMGGQRTLVAGIGTSALRIKSGTVYEVVVTRTSSSFSKAYYSIQYFTV